MGSTTTVRATVCTALAAAVLLLLSAPTPLESVRRLLDAGSAAQATGPLVALLALLAWTGAAYLLAVAALTAGGRLPGAVGAALGALARHCAPAGLRRALEVALGVTLVVGTLGGTASAAGPAENTLQARTAVVAPAVPAPVVAPAPDALPSLDHPASPPPSLDHAASPPPSLDHPTTPSPSLDHPTTSAARPGTVTPSPSLDWPGGPAPVPARPVSTAPAAPTPEPVVEQVVVRPGDSLWSLAEERLEEQTGGRVTDAQVAQAWPSWWQANREAVGDDPDLLHPGTPLVPPTAEPPTDS